MMWACELKSRSWWTDDANIVRICVELLHTLAVWLTDERCQHYFVDNCNLFNRFEDLLHTREAASRLASVSSESFCEWCIVSYMYKCGELCPGSVSNLLHGSSFSGRQTDGLYRVVCLQNAASAIVNWILYMSPKLADIHCIFAQIDIMIFVPRMLLTLQSCLCWIDQLANGDQALRDCFRAAVFLHVAYKTTRRSSLTDDMLDVLATTCLRSNDARRCLNARRSVVLSLRHAAVLLRVVARSSGSSSSSTVRLIEIELAKAYLHRALRNCEDSDDGKSVFCLANVYLAVLYCATRQHGAAIDHCTLATTRLQDHHSRYSSNVVQGELLPRIDDRLDSVLGLAVFYQYTREVELSEETERRHAGVFTAELFAHYLLLKFRSMTKCRQLRRTSLADERRLYRQRFCNSSKLLISDVLAFSLAKRTCRCLTDDHVLTADGGEIQLLPVRQQLDTSKLVELLQQSAVDHLSRCRELDALGLAQLTLDFGLVYAYKSGEYERCLELSMRTVRTLQAVNGTNTYFCIILIPECIQLLDDDIVSLIGLAVLVGISPSEIPASPLLVFVHQLVLSLYLATQCQIKLRHSVTSLATTLDYVQRARSDVGQMLRYLFDPDAVGLNAVYRRLIIDQHVLKYVEQSILRYMSVSRRR